MKKKIDRKFIEKWAAHMSFASFYDADDQIVDKIEMTDHPHVCAQIIKMFHEIGIK